MTGIINDIFSTIRFKTVIYFKYGFCKNWGMNVPKGNFAQFHIVTAGSCLLYIEGHLDPLPLQRGDIAIFPMGTPHQLKGSASSICLEGKTIVSGIKQGLAPFQGSEISTHLICGHFEIDRSYSHPILDQLPPSIIIKAEEYGRFDLIQAMLDLIMDELDQQNIGYQIVSTRLAEVLFISIIRHYYIHQPAEKLNLFKDALISKAVEIIHQDLSINWSIEQLARHVGISRTLFIERFKSALGEPPFKYITHWRMTKAKFFLQHTDKSLTTIAEELGYQSETAFNRAFKNHSTSSPGRFRKKHQQEQEYADQRLN